ncbi:MAG: PAS domain-containing protein [Gemmatirosa sp.]
MSFVPPTFLARIPQGVTRELADLQDFGVVQLADDGTVQLYNRWESALAGVDPTAAQGRNFFTQVAPCTNNRLVAGKFRDGVARGALDTEFSYTFTYKMKPTNVALRLYRDPQSATNWLFVGLR